MWCGFDNESGTPKGIIAVEGEDVGNSGGVIRRRRECDGGFFTVYGRGDDSAKMGQHIFNFLSTLAGQL